MAAMRLWSTAFVLNAAFILLSGASPEGRRCYWCGPLAEQVHRSRRSAPCGASDHVTDCEPGYNYCAIVATSPPRVESRYCVKMYQDECYPLFCNSTKTWKMTCPCRGDLCNGPNTERETDAFALLHKLVAKTHKARIKKRTANAAPHLIKHVGIKSIINTGDVEIHNRSSPTSDNKNDITRDNKLIVTEDDVISDIGGNPSQQSENMQSDQPTNIVIEHHNERALSPVTNQDKTQVTTNANNLLIEIEIHVSDPTKSGTMEENKQLCTETSATPESDETDQITDPVKDEGLSTEATIESISKIETSMKSIENNVSDNELMKSTEVVKLDVIKTKSTDEPHVEPATETMPKDQPMNTEEQMQNDAPPEPPTEIMLNDQPVNTVDQMQNENPPINPTDSIQLLKTTASKIDGMPPAEALQQNGSPPVSATPVLTTEKFTEPTTTETTTVPTTLTTHEEMTKITTTPTSRRKNKAVGITFSYALLLTPLMYL